MQLQQYHFKKQSQIQMNCNNINFVYFFVFFFFSHLEVALMYNSIRINALIKSPNFPLDLALSLHIYR